MASITFWTRLEPFTRLDDISPGLQAQIADPLWLLARQWQTGEFQGEDSGSPVQVRLRLERDPLVCYRPGSAPDHPSRPYRGEIPLEVLVEHESVQLPNDPRRDLRIAAEAGLYFLSLLESAGVSQVIRTNFIDAAEYKLASRSDDPAAGQDTPGQAYLSVMSGRVPDGFLLYLALKQAVRPPGGGAPTLPAHPVVSAAGRNKVIQAGLTYVDWFESRYSVPLSDEPTWNSERMEYSFAVSASADSAELALEASEYPGGSLDWYSFDLNPTLSLNVEPTDPQPESLIQTLIPTSLRFPGMAADRWWEFEDGQVNFSRIEGDPDELMRLLLVQFALVYSNDWYVLPVELSPGAIYQPQSLVVIDAFGEHTLVPHYSDLDSTPRDWRVFALTPADADSSSGLSEGADRLLFLPPVLAGSLHSDPNEEVLILRDELANLVWAIESLVPGLSGDPLNRYELYQQNKAQLLEPGPTSGEELRYLLATPTPDHWIPFLPVRIDPDHPDIRLRRAAALLEGGDGQPAFTRPWGRILDPESKDLSLFEEEVPRSGIRVVRQFQYTRWVNGSTILWLTRRKGPGRGQGRAGLYYDQVK